MNEPELGLSEWRISYSMSDMASLLYNRSLEASRARQMLGLGADDLAEIRHKNVACTPEMSNMKAGH